MKTVTTKAELLADLQQGWAALNATLAELSLEQMTTQRDAQGWTVKDHLVHLFYWQRSALFFLQGQPRHAGLDVDEALYLTGTEDAINAVIFHKQQATPLEVALAQLHVLNQQLLTALQPLSDADLQKSYRHYLPDEPGDGDGPPAMQVIYGNSAAHYAEHLAWIQSLLGG